MVNKLLKIVSAGVVISMCVSLEYNENSEKMRGAPSAVTNAPGELSCSDPEGGRSCHSGGIADNSGPGTSSISFSGGGTYVPGQTYTITASITHPISNRFGFEIVSLKQSDSAFAGTITLIDPDKTQTIQSATDFPDRIYVTHELAGTYPTTPHLGQWRYQWTAPSTNVGNINFYASFLAANNNNDNDPGDETYYTKITIAPSATGIAESSPSAIHMAVYPNPCSNYVYLSYYLYENTSIRAELLSADGKLIETLVASKNAAGSYSEKVALPTLPKGLYFIRSTVGKKEKISRIYVEG